LIRDTTIVNYPVRRGFISNVFSRREKSSVPIYDRNLDAAEVNVQRHHANLRRFYAVRIQLLLIIFILLFSFFLAESENVTNYTRAGDTTD
jgi:hypothetical protein